MKTMTSKIDKKWMLPDFFITLRRWSFWFLFKIHGDSTVCKFLSLSSQSHKTQDFLSLKNGGANAWKLNNHQNFIQNFKLNSYAQLQFIIVRNWKKQVIYWKSKIWITIVRFHHVSP